MATLQQWIPAALTVREATVEDGPALNQFVRSSFDERLGQHLSADETDAFMVNYLSGRHGSRRCFVALADGALVGYAVGSPSLTARPVLDRLYVRNAGNSREVAVALLAVVRAASAQPNWGTDPLEIYDRWGFVDLPGLRSCLTRAGGRGPLPAPEIAVEFQ
jgi:hypothetical protein